MDDSSALFHQYETEYCNCSTDISRKLGSLGPLTGGKLWLQIRHVCLIPAFAVHLLAVVGKPNLCMTITNCVHLCRTPAQEGIRDRK
jgi:hypothetical protein